MTNSNFIKSLLKILDPNIKLLLPNDTTCLDELPKTIIKNKIYTELNAVLDYFPQCCHHCGCKNVNHSIVRRSSRMTHPRHSILSNNQIRFNLKKTQFFCKECNRYFLAETPFVKKHHQLSRFTQNLIQQRLGEPRACNRIARDVFVSASTVHRTIDTLAHLMEKVEGVSPIMCIDEVNAISKKHLGANFSAVIMNWETRQITEILPNRRLSELKAHFRTYGLEERRRVEYFVTDMHLPYIRLAEEMFDRAEIVIDRFHIVQHLNKALDSVRIKEMNLFRKTNPDAYKKLKHLKKLLLKSDDKLDVTHLRTHRLFDGLMTESMMIEFLLHLSPKLRIAYDITHGLRDAFTEHDVDAFQEILEETKKMRLPKEVRDALRTVQNRLPYILNAVRYTYSNGPLEAANRMIKHLKRIACGFRNFKNLSTRIMWIQTCTLLWETSEDQRKNATKLQVTAPLTAGS